jgi:hypothetical protein
LSKKGGGGATSGVVDAVDMFGGLEKLRQYEGLKKRIDEVRAYLSITCWLVAVYLSV